MNQNVDEQEINDFLSGLDQEISKIDDEKAKTDAQARFEEAMRVYSGEDELISSEDILEQIKTQPEEEKFLTGMKGLDDILKGFRKNQLVVLAAPTKSGKSQMTVEFAKRMPDTKPVFLPFEESAEELVRKFHDLGKKPPLFYTPKNMSGNTLTWIEKKIVEGKVKYGSQMFIVDHLHFIVPFNSDRLDTRIGMTMRKLKEIAKKHEVFIILVAHLKKTNLTVSPTLEDLRDSSFIAQEADTVIMLWRQTKRRANEVEITNNCMLSVQANRRTGTTGNVKLSFVDGEYHEYDWNDDDGVTDMSDINDDW